MRWRVLYGIFIAFLQWITISVDGYKNFKASLRWVRTFGLRGADAERYQEPEEEHESSSVPSSDGSEFSSASPSVSSQVSMPPVILGGGGGVVPGNSVGYATGGIVGGAWQYANATRSYPGLSCERCGAVGRPMEQVQIIQGILQSAPSRWVPWCTVCMAQARGVSPQGHSVTAIKEEPKHRIIRFRKKGG